MILDLSSEKLLFQPSIADSDATRVIFAFPNEYSVGITSLGYQIIWASLAMRSDIKVSRYLLMHKNILYSNQN